MVIPIQSRLRDMALAKQSPIAPVTYTDPAQVTLSWSGSSFESLLSNPSAPPPTPTDSLLDISPRKSSFSSEYGMGAACAFPSWPNRPSLASADSNDSFTNNAYLSDEDLLWMPENAAVAEAVDEAGPQLPEMASSATMEQQIQRMQAIAEQQDRLRFLAKVEAHGRATQAQRQTKPNKLEVISERNTAPSKPRKRRVVPGPKRRTHSS
ncbi:hypothetical protein PENDEC_c004G01406 [Penicillium decumbens]|uniref:Uncharacterized protein n=1 Tax=Penicillium decumbens TaxID=69771 RepID=A0A1V6PHZ3_PENDC|nr:hypothetical protein PENDEC_c004G01406 [Penicillium decumbens]